MSILSDGDICVLPAPGLGDSWEKAGIRVEVIDNLPNFALVRDRSGHTYEIDPVRLEQV